MYKEEKYRHLDGTRQVDHNQILHSAVPCKLPPDYYDANHRPIPAGFKLKNAQHSCLNYRECIQDMIANANLIANTYQIMPAANCLGPEIELKCGTLFVTHDGPTGIGSMDIHLNKDLVFRYTNRIEVLKGKQWIIQLYGQYCQYFYQLSNEREEAIVKNIDLSEWSY